MSDFTLIEIDKQFLALFRVLFESAVEGDQLVRHGADKQGEKRLVVLASFTAEDPNEVLKERVLKVLAEYRVRAVAPEQVAAFAEEVEREAH